jgi:hypothetical protein
MRALGASVGIQSDYLKNCHMDFEINAPVRRVFFLKEIFLGPPQKNGNLLTVKNGQ